MQQKIRLFLLTVSFFLFAFIIYRNTDILIHTVEAVVGTLNLGTTSSQQTLTVTNKTIYQDDIQFGGALEAPISKLKSNGTLYVDYNSAWDTSGLPTGYGIYSRGDIRAAKLSAGTDTHTNPLEVVGISNLQGNVGIGAGASTPFTSALTIYDNSGNVNPVMINFGHTGSVNSSISILEEDSYGLGLNTSGKFYKSGNVSLGSTSSNVVTVNGSIILPNSNSITGVTNYARLSNGLSVGGADTYYFNSSGNLNANLIGAGTGTPNSTRAINATMTHTDTSGFGIVNQVTATGTLTANRTNYADYNVLTSTANNSSFSNTLYGALNQVTNSNGTGYNLAYGSNNYVVNNDASLTNATSIGSQGYVLNNATGILTSATGAFGQTINNTTGTISTARGVYGYVRNDDGVTTTAYGVVGLVDQAVAGGTTSTAYGGYFDTDVAGGTMTNAYGVYIADIAGTNQYGLYQSTSDDKNYFAGNVGIGSTSPGAKLDVVNTGGTAIAANGSTYGIYTTGTNYGIYSYGGANYFSGNVGIGTTTTTAAAFTVGDQAFKVTSAGTITAGTWNGAVIGTNYLDSSVILSTEIDTSAELATIVTNETGTGALVFGTSPTFTTQITTPLVTNAGILAFSATGANMITASTNGQERMRITSNGFVGIGTTNPQNKLAVKGNVDIVGDTSDAYLRITGSNSSYPNSITSGYNLTFDNMNAGSINFMTGTVAGGAANRLIILNNGNVGVGTSPVVKLDVDGAIVSRNGYGSMPANIAIGGGGSSPNAGSISWGDNTGWKLHFGTNVSGTFTPRMTIVDTGNVGINVTSPTYKLQVSGTIYISGSSREYKQDITNLEIDTSKLYQLRPVSFNYKPKYKEFGKILGGGKQIGLIAEEVMTVMPELAVSNGTKIANVDYEKISVLTLVELKKHNTKIQMLEQQDKELERENAQLKLRIQNLEKRIDKLEQMLTK